MRDSSCYSDKRCFVCLSYLDKSREDDGDRRDILELVELRSDKMERDVWHDDCRSQRAMCDGMLDGGELRKALHI